MKRWIILFLLILTLICLGTILIIFGEAILFIKETMNKIIDKILEVI